MWTSAVGKILVSPGDQFAWVELTLEPPFQTKICVGGRIAERLNTGLEDLLSVIDEAEEFRRSAIA
jgi:hypothetical protein